MLDKDKVVRKIKEIVDDGKSVQENVLEFLEKDMKETLEDYEKAKSSLHELVGGTLEAVKEVNLKQGGEQLDEFVTKAADTILGSVKGVASDAVEGAEILADRAREDLDRAIQAAAGDFDKVEEKVKEEMKAALTVLTEKTEAEKARLREAEDAVRKFVEQNSDNLGSQVNTALDETVDKSREYLKKFEIKTSEHIEKLLHHSDEKVNTWLNSLKKEK